MCPEPGTSWHLAQGSHRSLKILSQMRMQPNHYSILGVEMPKLYGTACVLGRSVSLQARIKNRNV